MQLRTTINSTVYCTPIFGWKSCQIMADTAACGAFRGRNILPRHCGEVKEAIQKGVIGEDGAMPADFMGSYVLPSLSTGNGGPEGQDGTAANSQGRGERGLS
jgi:hypothetical protein